MAMGRAGMSGTGNLWIGIDTGAELKK